jgi:hypothetical protein
MKELPCLRQIDDQAQAAIKLAPAAVLGEREFVNQLFLVQ